MKDHFNPLAPFPLPEGLGAHERALYEIATASETRTHYSALDAALATLTDDPLKRAIDQITANQNREALYLDAVSAAEKYLYEHPAEVRLREYLDEAERYENILHPNQEDFSNTCLTASMHQEEYARIPKKDLEELIEIAREHTKNERKKLNSSQLELRRLTDKPAND